jgi:hypothetical protein
MTSVFMQHISDGFRAAWENVKKMKIIFVNLEAALCY